MKVKPRDIPGVLKALDPGVRMVLVYGPDEGLVRERATTIGKQIAPDLGDPFQVVKPGPADLKETPSLLLDEIASLSMMGGRRLVWLDRAETSSAAAIDLVLSSDAGDGLLLVTAGDLKPSSAIRKAAEKARNALAIACYEDSAGDVRTLVTSTLSAAGLRASPDAVAYLVANLGSDRGVSRSELDKLVLYMTDTSPDRNPDQSSGEGGTVTLEDAKAVVGDTGAFDIAGLVDYAIAGDMARLDQAMERARIAGESPVALIRVAQSRLHRLLAGAGEMAKGATAAEAVQRLRPPVFWADRDAVTNALHRWPAPRILSALNRLMDAEIAAKTTGNPDRAIAERALLALARMAGRRR